MQKPVKKHKIQFLVTKRGQIQNPRSDSNSRPKYCGYLYLLISFENERNRNIWGGNINDSPPQSQFDGILLSPIQGNVSVCKFTTNFSGRYEKRNSYSLCLVYAIFTHFAAKRAIFTHCATKDAIFTHCATKKRRVYKKSHCGTKCCILRLSKET